MFFRAAVRVLSAMTVLSVCVGCGDAAKSAPASASVATPVESSPMSFDPQTITPGMLALGDSVFHGLIGATSCQACHGPDGAQGTVAPILNDSIWLHSDGSWQGIYQTIVTGVPAPKQFSSIMPPYGGAPLTPERTRAVAAYVYLLRKK